MFEKIKLHKDELIVFLGSMNAMPMMYAWELKKKGYDVLYFVDASKEDAISRPENHFPEIDYPYPKWIIEIHIWTQMLIPYLRKLFSIYLISKIQAASNKKISCFILNGFFISLSPCLKNYGEIISLSHGSDLDTWANKDNSINLASIFQRRSIFKFLPKFLSRKLIIKAVDTQYVGLLSSNAVVYFPEGFNGAGDSVINKIKVAGVWTFRRYDTSFEPLKNASREFRYSKDKLIIFSGVRFLYRTFPDGNPEYSKGNDIIIKGLAEYYKINNKIEVHFVEKGEDIHHAKKLCEELGLSEVVVWHKEMPFYQLIELFVESDICFDQVGTHWLAGIGSYALYLGKPLLANVNKAVAFGVFPNDHPVLCVTDPRQIKEALMTLENINLRKKISQRSKDFAEKNMSCKKLLDNLFIY